MIRRRLTWADLLLFAAFLWMCAMLSAFAWAEPQGDLPPGWSLEQAEPAETPPVKIEQD